MVHFVGGVDGVPGEHGHPGGLLLLALGALVGFSVMDASLLHGLLCEELDDGRLLGVGAHVLQRETDRLLLQDLTAM